MIFTKPLRWLRFSRLLHYPRKRLARLYLPRGKCYTQLGGKHQKDCEVGVGYRLKCRVSEQNDPPLISLSSVKPSEYQGYTDQRPGEDAPMM
jgi:hypothetical protein